MLDAPGLLSSSGLLSLPTSALPKSPSASSPLGGCPASCPDTYRLTHDHRRVRNWARLEIRLLILLRNNFFRLGTDFPMRAYKLVRGARGRRTYMNGR